MMMIDTLTAPGCHTQLVIVTEFQVEHRSSSPFSGNAHPALRIFTSSLRSAPERSSENCSPPQQQLGPSRTLNSPALSDDPASKCISPHASVCVFVSVLTQPLQTGPPRTVASAPFVCCARTASQSAFGQLSRPHPISSPCSTQIGFKLAMHL